MAAAERELKKERLYVRLSPHQREVINEAAEATQKDVSAFVLEAVLARADRILADRRIFDLNDERWNAFLVALDRDVTPVHDKPRLQKLLEQASLLEQ